MKRLARALAVLSGCGVLLLSGCGMSAMRSGPAQRAGFSFDCDKTPDRPCRVLAATHEGKRIQIEPSGVVWSERFGKAIVVSDNGNELAKLDASQFAISSFELTGAAGEIEVTALLSPEQARALPLYDLESVALLGDRLYTMGSLSLHPDDPHRDRWLRTQFVQMDLAESSGRLRATKLSPVTERWPDFRDWLISESGYPFEPAEIQGRAEGIGINVEALSGTSNGTLLIGFRGPEAHGGGALLLEIRMPASPEDEPALVATHVVPPLERSVPKTLRGLSRVQGQMREFYVLLGPQGNEKESLVLARWNLETGELSNATQLPEGVVAEGVTQVGAKRLLIVDDAELAVLTATER